MEQQVPHFVRQYEAAPAPLPEGFNQQEDIISPLPQGWNQGRQRIQPVIQIPAEASVLHLFLQGFIGRRHDAHIHIDDLVAAHAHDFPFLEDTEQLDLHGLAHSLHLIQEQGSLVGKFEQSRPPALARPGECALLISEQFAFQQILRHGSHIDCHKGAVAAPGCQMDRMGKQFLSCPSLPNQKHRGFRYRHLLQYLFCLADGRGCPNHIVKPVLGPVSLVEQLAAQFILPFFQLIKWLQGGKSPDTFPVPQNRNQGHVDIHGTDADKPWFQRRPGLHAFIKGNIRKYLPSRPAHDQAAVNPCNFLGLLIAGIYLTFFIDPDHPLIQYLKEDIKTALHFPGPGKHFIKAVVAGRHGLHIILELFFLQQAFQTQADGCLYHGAGCARPVPDIDYLLHALGHKSNLIRRHGNVQAFRNRRIRAIWLESDLVHPQLLQLGDCLPGHLPGGIHKQDPGPPWNPFQILYYLLGIRKLDFHHLPVRRDIPPGLISILKGIRGQEIQIRFHDSLHGPVPCTV